MSVHARVADEPEESFLDFEQGSRIPRGQSAPDTYIIVRRGKRYRVHEDGSSTAPGPTARHVVVGAMVRRYDPDAGELEGKPASFATPDEARAYIRRWL